MLLTDAEKNYTTPWAPSEVQAVPSVHGMFELFKTQNEGRRNNFGSDNGKVNWLEIGQLAPEI